MIRTLALLLLAFSAAAEDARPWTYREAMNLARTSECGSLQLDESRLWVTHILVGESDPPMRPDERGFASSNCHYDRMRPIAADPPTSSRCDAMREWLDNLEPISAEVPHDAPDEAAREQYRQAQADWRAKIEAETNRWCKPHDRVELVERVRKWFGG